MGHDNVNAPLRNQFLLKSALPYIVEPLTYRYLFLTPSDLFCTKMQSNSSPENQRFKQNKQLSSRIHTSATFKTDQTTYINIYQMSIMNIICYAK